MSSSIGTKLKSAVSKDKAYTVFKYFEPWNVDKRSREVEELAKADGVDMYAADYINTGNIAPHPFQSGFLFSTKKIRALIGPTQGGKSIPAIIEIGIMCSGELPISLQYDKGVDTGVRRLITTENIRRWGRYDSETGKLIDHDVYAERNGSWNCGNIIGAGKYPKEKIIPDRIIDEGIERTIWVGTKKKALDEAWWPKLTKKNNVLFPEKFIDRTKGNNGTLQSNGQHIIYLTRDIRLSLISYESDFGSFEAVKVWACYFDEEAVDKRAFVAALSHCKYFATQMTPYNGLTYTRDAFFTPDPEVDVFHATAYDSPYITDEDIRLYRSKYPEHELIARIWGEHTSESKAPYFRQDKLKAWTKRIKEDGEHGYKVIFEPDRDYDGVKARRGSSLPGLIDICSKMIPVCDDNACKNSAGHNIAWTIYEEIDDRWPYFIVCDNANGADIPEDALDFQAAVVMRPPVLNGEIFPKVIAEFETTSTPDIFAQSIGLALNYYNFALLCAEAPRIGAANGMFFSEMREYPYWFVRSIQRNNTTRYITQQGVDTNVGTRKLFFDEIEKVFNSYSLDDDSPVCSMRILQMAQECQKIVKGGRIKPDHPRNKPNDLLFTYGIGLWVWKNFVEQIKCRRKKKEGLEIAPRDSVISLLERSKNVKKSDNCFPKSHRGSRR